MLYDIVDAAFHAVVATDEQLHPIASGLGITEGTIWHPTGDYLIFSDLIASRIYRWTEGTGVSIIRQPSNITNGNYVDRQGRLLSCEHATSCVSRLEPDQRHIRVLASHYQGKEFNSPNDIVVDSQDRIWFTDPTYGRTSPRVGVLRDCELDYRGVFRLDLDGTVTRVADDYAQPNGLCFTPDETHMLVNDTDRGHIRRYRVEADGTLSGGAVLAEIAGEGMGKPDGMKVDVEGRIYCNGPGGVHVLTAGGDPLGVIRTPEVSRNFCFGGADAQDLFIAASTTIFRLRMKAKGLLPPCEA